MAPLLVLFACIALPAEDVELPCGVDRPRWFVFTALERVEAGIDRNHALEALACIAATEPDAMYSGYALRALFHLAHSDDAIRRYFLQVIGDARTLGVTRLTACGLLMYVADDDVRKVFLQQVREGWGKTDMGGQFWALVQLGDLDFLHWLDGIISELHPGDARMAWLQEQARLVRVQHNPQELFQLIRAEEPGIDRAWLVRQGMRNGVPRAELMQAMIDYLDYAKRHSRRHFGVSDMLKACEEYDLLSERQRRSYRRLRRSGTIISCNGPGPRWATLVEKKRDRFWGVTRN